MDRVIVALAWTLGAIFLVAAIGKIAAPGGPVDLIIATGEALLGLFLVVGAYPLIAGALVVVTAMAYCVYAIARPPDEDCRCFGRRLPASSRVVQRVRSAVITALAAAYLLLALTGAAPSGPSVSVVFAGLGLLSGVVVVIAPWLVEWALTPVMNARR